METARQPAVDPKALVREATALRSKNAWEEIAALASSIPVDFDASWLAAVDHVAFALGQLARSDAAIALTERAFDLEPTHRRASALAYLYYDTLLRHKNRKPRLSDPEPYRKAFERWIAEALRLRPDSLVDHYRLGVYLAQVHSQKDVKALEAFRYVLRLWDRIPEAERTYRHPHFKVRVKALYAAARSAYRLGRLREAWSYACRCIRDDEGRDHIAPLYKFFLAAKILHQLGRHADAERGLRKALEVPHDGPRDFVHALLAEVALAQGRPDDAVHWIDLNIRPHHRKPYVWRLLGQAEAARGKADRALAHYRSALMKDHVGRHLTLLKIGTLHEQRGNLREARRAYEQAADFKRRRFHVEDPAALRALARVCEGLRDLDGARSALRRMAELPLCRAEATAELERLAG